MLDSNTRSAGILLHPTSLPSNTGIGEIGPHARRFVTWLADTGVKLWQVLPIVPPGSGHSPYSSWSAFAGSPLLISLEDLCSEGWLTQSEVDAIEVRSIDWVHYQVVKEQKMPLLERAATRFIEAGECESAPYITFTQRCANWLTDAATFTALDQSLEGPWWDWPTPLRTYKKSAVRKAVDQFQKEIRIFKVLQYFFDQQWSHLRRVCDEHGVQLIGDLPIYVDHHSADVWANQSLFALDGSGKPSVVAGVPPDAFSDTGQLWGNPIYDWTYSRETQHQWWVERLSRAFELTHSVRIDHFRAFSEYWEVPYGEADARTGSWVKGPGIDFFNVLREKLSDLPVIAEDLGMIDQAVHDLVEATGFPGMKVLQFAFGSGNNNLYLPHNHTLNSVVYTGTHDNDTTLGWWKDSSDYTKHHIRSYLGVDGHDIVWDIIRIALSSVAQWAIVPMQDLLTLSSETRMNRPSVAHGNWRWRVREEAFNHSIASRFKELIELYNRG